MDLNSKGNYISAMSGWDSTFQCDPEPIRSVSKMETSQRNHSQINSTRPREILNHSNLNYQPQQTNLEKLFSHATEVKGDLESVINALVGIIGTGTNETSIPPDDDGLLRTTTTVNECPNNNYQKTHGTQSNWARTNKVTPSVNVENVLKIVRANKINKEMQHMKYDSSQSSESSREKVPEKVEYPVNMYEYSMRSLLSDPGHMERRIQSIDIAQNRRKLKTKHYLNGNADTSLMPTDAYIKRSKSIKSANEVSHNLLQLPVPNIMPENSWEPSENCHRWVNSAKHSSTLGQSESRELYNLHNQDMNCPGTEQLDCSFYKHQSNYGWNQNKDVANALDESSCSSWSLMSQNQILYPQSQGIIRNSCELNIGMKTPSVSVSDSEGSTEPIRPIPVKRIPRLPSLGTQLRSKEGQYEFLLINQPEQHHRARYMTEGSRGSVKDRSGNGFPTVQLVGWHRPATLQIFVGTEEGRVKPHSFYQACKVSGKQILSCKERMFDGTGLIEIQIEAKENQIIVLDCIGILKLRNVDVERRAGIQRVKLKSTMARLVFRVNLPHGDGFFTCLQVTSDQILCTQPVGSPEICKMSLCEGSCKGNMELFIIGKNIVKCCQVLFQDFSEHKGVIWQSEARLDVEYLHQSHLICTVPPYCDENLKTPVTVQVVISCNGRLSEPRYFTYLSDTSTKHLEPMDAYDIDEWKMLKTNYSNMTTFPIENCHLNSELSRSNGEENFIKSTNEIMYEPEYDKATEPSFSHILFPPSSNSTNYNTMSSPIKSLDNRLTRTVMDWLPCTSSNDISIANIGIPSSFDAISNSLDSNIQSDFMPYFPNMTIIQSESQNTLTESNDLLTNL